VTRVSSWRRISIVTVAVIAALVGFATWYRFHFSMSPARAFEVNDPHSSPRVLIATQGSEFKDAVVAAVVEHLKARAAHVRVIDVTALRDIESADWNAIVIIHTWEMRKPPGAVKDFVERTRDSGQLVVLTTSGEGTFKMDGIDAISSASVDADVLPRAADIEARVDAILRAGNGK
jgi:hypothetical protein